MKLLTAWEEERGGRVEVGFKDLKRIQNSPRDSHSIDNFRTGFQHTTRALNVGKELEIQDAYSKEYLLIKTERVA